MMSDTHLLRQMVNERLAAAAEEIFGLVEKTMAEYQDEVVRCRSEVIVLKKQMEQLSVLKPEVQLLKTDVQVCALPDQNPTVENSDTPNHEQAKEEQSDLSSSSDLEEPDCYEDYQVPLSDSDLPCPTMSFNEEENWKDINNPPTPSCDPISSDPISSDIPFTDKKPVQRHKMERYQIQKNQTKECRLCHACFQTNAELKRHMDKNHMGEKSYICRYCDRGFDQEYQLAVHVRIHTGEKPYSCDFCGKTFAQNSNRIVHMRQHTGERPYYCTNCNKSFSSSNHLKWCGMKQKKGGKKAFPCRTCSKTFDTDLDLTMHEEVHMSWKQHLEEN